MLRVSLRARARRWVLCWRCSRDRSDLSRLARSSSMRRSSSSWRSPGPPRMPIPPFCRSRWLHARTSRDARYCTCASSTCTLPTWLCARCPKISRIRPVRSITWRCRKRSRLRCCAGLSAWLNTTTSASSASAASFSSSALPEPMNKAGSGRARRPVSVCTGSEPAVVVSSASSLRLSWKSCLPKSTPTRMAREGAVLEVALGSKGGRERAGKFGFRGRDGGSRTLSWPLPGQAAA